MQYVVLSNDQDPVDAMLLQFMCLNAKVTSFELAFKLVCGRVLTERYFRRSSNEQ